MQGFARVDRLSFPYLLMVTPLKTKKRTTYTIRQPSGMPAVGGHSSSEGTFRYPSASKRQVNETETLRVVPPLSEVEENSLLYGLINTIQCHITPRLAEAQS